MNIASLIERRQPGRKVQGIAAALLPYEADGRVAVESFKQHLIATHQAGLMNAVNMDTGYVNYLSEVRKARRAAMDCRSPGQETFHSWPELISKIKPATSSLSTGSRWT